MWRGERAVGITWQGGVTTGEVALAADLRGLREHEEADKVESDALLTLTRIFGAQHPHPLSARQRNRPYWDFEAYLG
ncbi:hypothetical protein [Streptomyces hypolithicus]